MGTVLGQKLGKRLNTEQQTSPPPFWTLSIAIYYYLYSTIRVRRTQVSAPNRLQSNNATVSQCKRLAGWF